MSVAGFKLTLWIPVEQVGIVIGRSGQTINKIQGGTSSRLSPSSKTTRTARLVSNSTRSTASTALTLDLPTAITLGRTCGVLLLMAALYRLGSPETLRQTSSPPPLPAARGVASCRQRQIRVPWAVSEADA